VTACAFGGDDRTSHLGLIVLVLSRLGGSFGDHRKPAIIRDGAGIVSTSSGRRQVACGGAQESVTAESTLTAIAESFPNISLKPYFDTFVQPPGPVPEAGAEEANAEAALLQSYLVAELQAGEDPASLARALTARPDVEIAYVEGGPTPPPALHARDPLSEQQGYLVDGPAGINARWAWTKTDGAGVGFVDLERGWTLDHEDLTSQSISVISGLNKDFFGHGTAVLGEVAAAANDLGGVGIAPGLNARVVSQWRSDREYRTDLAIRSAVAAMQRGDVLLLEAQTPYATSGTAFVPVEVEESVFDAIRFATDNGIVVVEAGANGSVDLDAFVDMSGRRILDRSSSDFRDSGAIMIGAGSAVAPHQRLWFSNFGSRIDCFAWGELIVTCGDGGVCNARNSYTSQFGGTSGASPIVTGAAIILQAWARQQGKVYSPHELRSVLSDRALGTASANPEADRIGVMPDLRTIIEHELTQSSAVAAVRRAGGGVA
jgi:subtilisin family serine protease